MTMGGGVVVKYSCVVLDDRDDLLRKALGEAVLRRGGVTKPNADDDKSNKEKSRAAYFSTFPNMFFVDAL
jgi:hypothetical protein